MYVTVRPTSYRKNFFVKIPAQARANNMAEPAFCIFHQPLGLRTAEDHPEKSAPWRVVQQAMTSAASVRRIEFSAMMTVPA